MIIVRLLGGLGNQMFQYALGRSLALKNNTELKLDITAFEVYKLHKYSLGEAFGANIKISSKDEINEFRRYRTRTGKRWFLRNLLLSDTSKYFREKFSAFDPEVLTLGSDVYLDGYWQSEKYFKKIESVIRTDFSFTLPQGERDKEVFNLINESNSVSIHIRRADYVTDANANKTLGTCSAEYYTKAVDILVQKVTDPHFFVFSDDHEWVRKHITINYPAVYVDHNSADTNFQDMRLMASCKHNIIANSSFSWWGAWLNGNQNKIVIAPKQWFADASKNDSDLIPSTWTRI